ncbi:MAG: SAM-dependent methyltransferase [Bacteroidales bacterium]
MPGKLYLIPSSLGDSGINRIIPGFNLEIINHIHHYIVEDIRSARRFLSKCGIKTRIDDLTFYTLNKFTQPQDFENYLNVIKKGNDTGLISEAGCPAVADPGAEITRLAHLSDIEIVPLVGPSSILLALMASGLNGQKFAFNGYLPVKENERQVQLKKDEQRSKQESQTQIYIETPYRNNQLLKSLTENLQSKTRLCVAADLTLDTESIKCLSVNEWKKINMDLNKKPCIFLFLA